MHSFIVFSIDSSMSGRDSPIGPNVVGEFGDANDDNQRSRGRGGVVNTAPSTAYKFKLTRGGRESTPKRLKTQSKACKRVGVGHEVVELLSSQEPSPPARNVPNRPSSSRAVDLTRDDGEFEIVSCTVKKTPVRSVPVKRNTKVGGAIAGPQQAALSATLQMMLRNSKEVDDDSSNSSPQCGICFEAMGKNTDKPMAAGNCGHVYCKPCLIRAVKQRRKCPGCSAKMTGKQIRNIFFDI